MEIYQENKVNKSSALNAIPAVIIFIIIYLFIYQVQGIYMIDDAFIFYRYAENWANGYGLVYNVNEYVEGYSSFLWVALLAIGALFSFSIPQFAPIMNLFIGIMCIFLMNYITGFINFSRPQLTGIVISLIYICSYGVYLYGISGMDTLLFSLILLSTLIILHKSLVYKKYIFIIPFLILLNITRVEGPLYSTVLMIILIYIDYKETKSISRQLIMVTVVFIILTILLFIVRYLIYNEILPATIQAKGYASYSLKKFIFEGDIRALKEFLIVIKSGIKYISPLFYIGIWLPFILVKKEDKKEYILWLIISSIVVNIFVSIIAGGDWMPFHRHFIPSLPLIIILIAWAIDSIINSYRKVSYQRRFIITCIILIIGVSWIVFIIHPLEFIKKHNPNLKVISLQQLGIFLRNIPASTILMTDRAGILPYYAGINVYVRDFFGLTDIHNAKYGDVFCMPPEGGVCGRTDYYYSFATPFDIFSYSAININKRFISFCKKNPDICKNYRFYKKEEWLRSRFYIIANINHPVSNLLKKEYKAVPIPIDENLEILIRQYKIVS